MEIDSERLNRIKAILEENNECNVDFPTPSDTYFISAAKDLVKRCLTANPEERPSFADILAHGFFADQPLDNSFKSTVVGGNSAKTHFFLSHTQSQASGAVKDIYYYAKELVSWLNVWIVFLLFFYRAA